MRYKGSVSELARIEVGSQLPGVAHSGLAGEYGAEEGSPDRNGPRWTDFLIEACAIQVLLAEMMIVASVEPESHATEHALAVCSGLRCIKQWVHAPMA
jgi:hypothetical protein